MLFIVTHLKAPWPAGTQVGDVLDLPDVPLWAVGKCQPAPEGAEPSVPPMRQEPEQESNPDIEALRAEAEAAGLKVDRRWGAERLAEEIAKAKG